MGNKVEIISEKGKQSYRYRKQNENDSAPTPGRGSASSWRPRLHGGRSTVWCGRERVCETATAPGGRRGGRCGAHSPRHRRPRVSRQCWPEEEAGAAVGDDPARLSQDPAEARSPPTEMSRQTATGLSTGTSQTGTTSCNSQWASLFQCPMCFNHVLPPIPRCQSGHLVCSNCRPKISRWDPFATCLWRKWPIQSFFL